MLKAIRNFNPVFNIARLLMADQSPKLKALRELMSSDKQFGKPIDAYYCRTTDAHNSEYLAAADKRVAFISGFTGSNGSVIVTKDKALLWTDGRYFDQAANQLSAEWILMKNGLPGVPKIEDWLADNLSESSVVSFNPFLVNVKEHDGFKEVLSKKKIEFRGSHYDLIEKVWGSERPSYDKSSLLILDVKYAGEDITAKLEQIRKEMRQQNVTLYVLTGLDEIAWTLNLRGADIPYNPVFFSYFLISMEHTKLFVNKEKLTPDAVAYLQKYSVQTFEYTEFLVEYKREIESSTGFVFLPNTSSYALYELIPSDKLRTALSPVIKLKSVKNSTEIECIRNAHIRDAVALCEFLYLLEKNKPGTYDELTAADTLAKLRGAQKDFVSLSFSTISAFGPNAAIIHYSPSKETNLVIDDTKLYLIDSGGQYMDGTTDVTRTIHLGTPTEYEKKCFTAVLRGFLKLAASVFPANTPGIRLDSFARAFLWELGLNYGHGTGHGIGFFLNVHEGPFSVSVNTQITEPLQVGNVLSDEPGYYESGKFGMRIENAVLCVKANPPFKPEKEEFLTFEHFTLVPIQKKLIDKDALLPAEISQLNAYHAKVRDIIGAELKKQGKAEVAEWLIKETEPL